MNILSKKILQFFAIIIAVTVGSLAVVHLANAQQPQAQYPVVSWDLSQQQDNFGQYIYLVKGDVRFVNMTPATTLDLRFGSSVNNLSTLLKQYTATSSTFSFSTDIDPALLNITLDSGEYYYVGLFADNTLLSFQQLSAYEYPNDKIVVNWSHPLIKEMTPGDFYIHLQANIDRSTSSQNLPLFATLGAGLGGHLVVEEFSSAQVGMFLPLFDSFTDISSGQSQTISPNTTYYTFLANSYAPVAGMQVGMFTGTGAPPSGGTQRPPTGPNAGNVGLGDSTVNPLIGGVELDNTLPPDGLVPCTGDDCGFNEFIQLLKNVFDLVVLLMIPFIAVILTYVGFLFITGGSNPAKRKKAAGILLKMAIGIVIILLAWLIVATILRTLGVDKGSAYTLLEL